MIIIDLTSTESHVIHQDNNNPLCSNPICQHQPQTAYWPQSGCTLDAVILK